MGLIILQTARSLLFSCPLFVLDEKYLLENV